LGTNVPISRLQTFRVRIGIKFQNDADHQQWWIQGSKNLILCVSGIRKVALKRVSFQADGSVSPQPVTPKDMKVLGIFYLFRELDFSRGKVSLKMKKKKKA